MELQKNIAAAHCGMKVVGTAAFYDIPLTAAVSLDLDPGFYAYFRTCKLGTPDCKHELHITARTSAPLGSGTSRR